VVRVPESTREARDESGPEPAGPVAPWELGRRGPTLAVAGGGLAAVLAGCGTSSEKQGTSGQGSRSQPPASSAKASDFGSGDVGIVNYALTLEYFESDFYNQVEKSGLVKGQAATLLKSITRHESQHVTALEQTIKKLGAKAAPRVVSTIPLRNERQIIQMAAMLENIGASAYLGQANRIQSKPILSAALSIHSIEARHAAVLGTLAGNSIVPDGSFARAADMDTVLLLATPFMRVAGA